MNKQTPNVKFYRKAYKEEGSELKKDEGMECTDEKDLLHHYFAVQSAYISVQEEEERIRNEIEHKGKELI